jgi:hypothetical protein
MQLKKSRIKGTDVRVDPVRYFDSLIDRLKSSKISQVGFCQMDYTVLSKADL